MSVVFTRDNRNAQDFTSDRARLLKAVDTFTVGFRGHGRLRARAHMDDLWYLNSVGVLERAVDFLADVPDRRKAIIYVGQGLPFDIGTAVTPVVRRQERGRRRDELRRRCRCASRTR